MLTYPSTYAYALPVQMQAKAVYSGIFLHWHVSCITINAQTKQNGEQMRHLLTLACLVLLATFAHAQADDDGVTVAWDSEYPQIERVDGQAVGYICAGTFQFNDPAWYVTGVVVTFVNRNDQTDYGKWQGDWSSSGGTWSAVCTGTNLYAGTLPKTGKTYAAYVTIYYEGDGFGWYTIADAPAANWVEGLW